MGLGAITTQAKLYYADGGDALSLMLVRFLCSVTVIALLIGARRGRFAFERRLVRPVAVLGLVWSGSMICYLLSVQTVSVSLAVLILYSFPILVLAGAVRAGRVRPSARAAAWFLAAFAGLCLALFNGETQIDPLGAAFAACAALGSAYTFLAGARIAPKMDPMTLTLWVNATGIAIIVPLTWGEFQAPRTPGGALALAGATLCYVAAILCQFQALARVPAATAAFILNLEPLVSIALAMLVLGESLTPWQWVGAALVLAVLLASPRFLAAPSRRR